jgi:hypothetical protein
MSDRKCQYCDDYKARGHNYCRMCGFHLKKGQVQNVRIASGYSVSEKYCGYCGGPKYECKCEPGKK